MIADSEYLFKSARLGFRAWQAADIDILAEMNNDAEVMKYFPGLVSKQETTAFVQRMQQQHAEKGYCYFAVDKLSDGKFIGFIGLSDKTFAADFTPCVDIGWRLKKEAWGSGLATEGALRSLQYAFDDLRLPEIYSMAPEVNTKSEQIMKKIGMERIGTFKHPLLKDDARLETCVLYKKIKPQ